MTIDVTTANATQPTTERRAPARERLLDAADELFYAQGVQRTGIDRVIERAGVAKASLYNSFGSKEALIGAYLDSRHAQMRTRVETALARYENPRAKLLGVFDAQAELFAEPGYHGCAFVSASAEAPPGGEAQRATDAYRMWLRKLLTDLATEARAANPSALARQLHLLFDGAALSVRLDHDTAAAKSARLAATALIDIAIDGPIVRKDLKPDKKKTKKVSRK